MTLTTPSPISDQAADLLEKAALVCENMACAPQFEPEIQDRMLRAAAKSIRALSTAPTTGSAPETDDTFIEAYKVGAKLCGTIHEANKAIVQGHGSSWYPLYRKNHPKPASPAASALSEDAILAIAIDHGLGTAVVESIVKALLAASMGGDRT